MSNPVRLSVVVPIREPPGDLGTAVRSVLESQLTELEVIVVQSERSGAPASLDDPRIVTVHLRSGAESSRALNVGVARARGPYVAFLSPAELIGPDRLGAAADALDRHHQAGFAISGCDSLQSPCHVSLENGWSLIPRAQLARALLAKSCIALSSVVIRRQLLTEIGAFDERLTYCMDLDLWFRLAHRCDALYREQAGHTCRGRGASASNPEDARSARDRITVLQREKARWSGRSEQRLLDRRIAQSYAELGHEERRRRHRLRSIAMFASAFATSPQARWLLDILGAMR